MDTLQKSKYASLIKVAKSVDSIPVSVQKGNPSALPIEPQYLKKSFSDIRDQWYADRGTANGRLEQKQFDPPPIESVYEIFAFHFDVLQITDDETAQLTAVDTWPLVAASLSYPGTFGPYWYFIKKTSDLGQMESYMNKAVKVAGKNLQTGFKEFKPSFDAFRNGRPLSKSIKYVNELLTAYEQSCDKRSSLLDLSKKYLKKEKELCADAQIDLQKVVDEEIPVGEILIKLAEDKYSFTNEASRRYWARVLCESSTEVEDASGLVAILKHPELAVAHTAARKAIRIIDFINYGPKIE